MSPRRYVPTVTDQWISDKAVVLGLEAEIFYADAFAPDEVVLGLAHMLRQVMTSDRMVSEAAALADIAAGSGVARAALHLHPPIGAGATPIAAGGEAGDASVRLRRVDSDRLGSCFASILIDAVLC